MICTLTSTSGYKFLKISHLYVYSPSYLSLQYMQNFEEKTMYILPFDLTRPTPSFYMLFPYH
jgi:hypothetical protein